MLFKRIIYTIVIILKRKGEKQRKGQKVYHRSIAPGDKVKCGLTIITQDDLP